MPNFAFHNFGHFLKHMENTGKTHGEHRETHGAHRENTGNIQEKHRDYTILP